MNPNEVVSSVLLTMNYRSLHFLAECIREAMPEKAKAAITVPELCEAILDGADTFHQPETED